MAPHPAPTPQATPRELLARVEHLETLLGQLQRQRQRRHSARRLVSLLLAALLVALVPLASLAASFIDLNPGSPHNTDINLIADAGISKGCTDTLHYCPNDYVTRQQMASFLARTAGLGSNPPIANAATATNAGNANTVGGYAPAGLVRVAQADSADTTLVPTTDIAYGRTLSITAPAAGFVLVTAGYTVSWKSGATRVYAHLLHDESGHTSMPAYASINSSTQENTLALTSVFPVNAGVNTFDLRTVADSADSANGYYMTMTALYVPFGSTGAGALGALDPPAQPAKRP